MHAQPISFRAPLNTLVGKNLDDTSTFNGLVIADFNGDGKPDVAYLYGSYGSSPKSTLSVVLGSGDGTFQPGYSLQLGARSLALWSGDFNGDGKVDLGLWSETSDGQIKVSVFLSNGNGTFGPATVTAFPFPSVRAFEPFPGKVFVVDANHDGKLDVVIGIYLLLGKGDGTFHPVLITGDPVSLLVDLNADGNADIVQFTSSGGFSVALGKGDGTFSRDRDYSLPISGYVTAGDFNGDGKIDLAFAGAGNFNYPFAPNDVKQIAVVLGNGDGSFQPAQVFSGSLGTGLANSFVFLAADLTRTGKLDLVAGNAVLSGNGDGTFQLPLYQIEPPLECKLPSSTPCVSAPVLSVSADLNGDGLPDLVLAYQQTIGATVNRLSLSVLLNDTTGSGFTVPGVSSASYTSPVGYDSLVTAFGIDLAPAPASAKSIPLPTHLGGIHLHIRGSDGVDQLAPLLYVSPSQINYVLPSGTSGPFAALSIERDGTPFVERAVSVPLDPSAAALFVRSPSGLAVASAIRVNADGSRTDVPVVQCSASGCAAVPIDVTKGAVYLSLYGTGFAVNVDGSPFKPGEFIGSCDVNEQAAPILFAGPQGQFPGVDQVNIKLPASLAGSGDTIIDCFAKVRIDIQ